MNEDMDLTEDDEIVNKPWSSGRFWKIFGILCGLVVVLFIVGRLTGMLEWYSVSSSGNAPAMQSGDNVFSTNLVTPERFDFVVFKDDKQTNGEVWIKRLCAFGGETVEIRNGDCFINDKILDRDQTLSYAYRCATARGEEIVRRKALPQDAFYYDYPYQDSMTIILTKAEALSEPALVRIFKTEPDSMIQACWGEPWNISNFGPITVPQNHYFLMGDSRDNSLDSRYIGSVSQDNILGVVL